MKGRNRDLSCGILQLKNIRIGSTIYQIVRCLNYMRLANRIDR